MGKVDELRRMREARFAAARTTTPAAAPRPASTRKAAAVAAPAAAPEPPAPAGETDALCGHRSIGNKSCTREKDHQKSGTKNHRYG